MFTVEITAAIDAAGTLRTFYVSDDRLITGAADTPAHQSFDETLIDPANIAITAFGDGRTGGGTRLSNGEVRLTNADGQYDGWLDYGFDGRPVIVRSGPSGGAYPAAFTVVFSGTLAGPPRISETEVTLTLRDKQQVFDQPALQGRYGGTNVLPNGVDGTANDLKGQAKPRLFGRAYNFSPPCVNTSKLVYQISDGTIFSVDGVYDRGAPLTNAGDVADTTTLLAATVAGGTFKTCVAAGLIRLGGTPAGTVTVDATQGSNSSARTCAQVLKALALTAGLSSGEISDADVLALDTANAATVGIWVSQASDTFTAVMDKIAASVGAYYGFDGPGVLRMARLELPAATADFALSEEDSIGRPERRPARDGDLPCWALTVQHSRIGVVQDTDIAAGVAADRRAFLATEFRLARAQDATVKNRYLLATEETVETCLTDETSAGLEAARQLAMFKSRRDFFDVVVPASILTANQPRIMQTVALTSTRFGLSAGRNLRILGIKPELADNRATLTLWG